MSDQYSPPLASYADDEKKVVHSDGPDIEGAAPSGRARWLGGNDVFVGPRIGPVLSSLSNSYSSDTDDSSSAILHRQKEAEATATIKYRTCSWQKVCAKPPSPFSAPGSRRLALFVVARVLPARFAMLSLGAGS